MEPIKCICSCTRCNLNVSYRHYLATIHSVVTFGPEKHNWLIHYPEIIDNIREVVKHNSTSILFSICVHEEI